MRRIKATVRQSSAAMLDLTVGVDNYSIPISSALRQPGSREYFMDVPLRAVIALGHKNFAKTAGTWRALLAGLHGTTWSDDAITYFESEIGTQHFPAPDANLPLDQVAVGGMVGVSNGMHRATAAICWLADPRRRCRPAQGPRHCQ
ncbi:hypothetical protein E2553_40095 [Paraburkholderia dipogonis]|uniref:Uncharacterized protein n=2 Tax=Paraburkholderia dipogonis TaxID=1211383 RepID=A0A4Y8MJH3_9BURK|nr:hypothetical protein [Paraburkholderia dipogonis]TFE37620.1 hypothetical protein E2553_40095 [Paraburkholderia dipogonis]